MSTEDANPRFAELDAWSTLEALKALHDSQIEAVAAIAPALPALAAAVEDAAPRLSRGGRLIYAGAGTSARIGVQDGAELFPTFNWPKEQVAFVIAGGESALLQAIENAEDLAEAGAARVGELGLARDDVLLGIAASGATPFTLGAVAAANDRGALTIGIANNAGSQLLKISRHGVLLDTGEEPVAGSTRLKAGTAQKVALNLFSTMVMVRLGRVYRGLMVDMRPTNEKLRRRSVAMVKAIAGCSEAEAARALADADGDIKLASLLAKGVELARARQALDRRDGNLRLAMADLA